MWSNVTNDPNKVRASERASGIYKGKYFINHINFKGIVFENQEEALAEVDKLKKMANVNKESNKISYSIRPKFLPRFN